jgi:hypothetical protein
VPTPVPMQGQTVAPTAEPMRVPTVAQAATTRSPGSLEAS